jgi:hypothetical protein
MVHNAMILELLDLGAVKAVINYSGGGDSGAVDEVEFRDANDNVLKLDDRREEIEDMVYPLLNTLEDWWNNEGGYGLMVLDLRTGEYHIENTIYIQHTEEFTHTGTLELKE